MENFFILWKTFVQNCPKLSAELFDWFFENDYGGEDILILQNPYMRWHGDGYGSNPVNFKGAVYYHADAGETAEEAFSAMMEGVCGIFTQEENLSRNGYVMTAYKIYPTNAFATESRPYSENLETVGDQVWLLHFPYVLYRFEGKDSGLTFEELKAEKNEEWINEDGLIPCEAEGSDEMFYQIIIKKGDIYLMANQVYFTGYPDWHVSR